MAAQNAIPAQKTVKVTLDEWSECSKCTIAAQHGDIDAV